VVRLQSRTQTESETFKRRSFQISKFSKFSKIWKPPDPGFPDLCNDFPGSWPIWRMYCNNCLRKSPFSNLRLFVFVCFGLLSTCMHPLLLTARTSTTGARRVDEKGLRADPRFSSSDSWRRLTLVLHAVFASGPCVCQLCQSPMDSLLSRFEGMKKSGTKTSRDCNFLPLPGPALLAVLTARKFPHV